MRLSASAHESQPWVIHQVADGFRLEDVWALPATGGPDDFGLLVELVRDLDPANSSSPIVRALFAARERLGGLFGWDKPQTGAGARVPTLRDRVPEAVRSTAPDDTAGRDMTPFTPLYRLEHEWAAEAANATMHGVLHLGWVPDPERPGGWRGQLAILVKPNGLVGNLYMAAIKPFRHLFVYPMILREAEQQWRARTGQTARR